MFFLQKEIDDLSSCLFNPLSARVAFKITFANSYDQDQAQQTYNTLIFIPKELLAVACDF